MDMTLTTPASDLLGSLDTLIKHDQYLSALELAESHYGPWTTWRDPATVKIAIRILSHLGNDRAVTALQLIGWRRFPKDADFCQHYLFHLLSSHGPIVMERQLQRHRVLHGQGEMGELDNRLADAVLLLERKDVDGAEPLIDAVLAQQPNYLWARRLKVSLLDTRDDKVAFLAAAEALFSERPTLSTLNLWVSALRKNQQLEQARDVLWTHAAGFQSVRPYRQLITLCQKLNDFSGMAKSLDCYQALLRHPDRDESTILAAAKARLALYHGDLAAAREHMTRANGSYYHQLHQHLQAATVADIRPVVLPVPHEQQGHLTCAPATMTALCRYFGYEVSQQEIIQAICYDGTPDVLERRWLTQHGFCYIERTLTPQLCYQLIDAKLPFAFVTTSGSTSHLQAVIGYHKALGVALLMDPGLDTPVEYLLAEGLAEEQSASARALIFVPKQQAERLTPFYADDVQLFALYADYQQARMVQDILQMKQVVANLAARAPEHLLTTIAQRSLAIELDDERTIAELTLQLLAQYPDSVPWRLSYVQSLITQGHTTQAIEYLQQELQVRPHNDLRLRLFRLIYSLQPYQWLTLQIRQQLERYGSYNARVYDALADYAWQQKNYEEATRHYYFACCLDDTDIDYFESYFKACRFLNRADTGLALAQRQFDKYAARSMQPAKLLYRLFDQQKQYRQALQVLDQARQLRPDDPALYEFALGELLHQAQVDSFDQWLATASSLLPDSRMQYWHGRRAEWHGDLAKAAEHYHVLFAQSPLNYQLASPYLRALKAAGMQERLLAELGAMATQAAHYPVVLDYQANFHPEPAVRNQAVAALATLYPYHVGRQRDFIRGCLDEQRLEDALRRAEQLLAHQPDHIEFKVLLARVYKGMQRLDQAEVLLKEVLGEDPDHDEASTLLLRLRVSTEWKQQQIDFLLDQLTSHTLYGNGIFDCWFEGQQVMTPAQRQRLIEQVVKPNVHLWQSRLVWAWSLQATDLPAAIAQLEQSCRDFPLLPRPYVELAQLYRANQQVDDAIAAFQTALTLNPSWSFASRLLAECLASQGRYADEADVLQQALRHDSADAILHGWLADAHKHNQQPAAAIVSLQRAVALDPDYIWAWRLWLEFSEQEESSRQLLEQTAQAAVDAHRFAVGPLRILAECVDDATQKLGYLQQAIARQPHNDSVHHELLVQQLELGHYPEVFAHLAQYYPTERPLLLLELQARAHAETGQLQAAAQVLAQYLRHAHADTWYYRKLFGLLEQLKDQKQLAEFALLLIEREPHDATALCRAGEALEGLKLTQYHQHITDSYQRAFALSPADQYIGLTLIDWLQQQKDWPAADAALAQLWQFSQDGWVLSRKVLSAVRQQQAQALDLWQQLLAHRLDNQWVYSTPLAFAGPVKGEMLALLQQALAQGSDAMGRVYTEHMLTAQQVELEQFLLAAPLSTGVAGAWIGYLWHYQSLDKRPARSMFEAQFAAWQCWPSILLVVAEICNAAGHWSTTLQLLQDVQAEHHSMQLKYKQLIACLALGRIEQAAELASQAVELERDQFFHNILLWDLALQGASPSADFELATQLNPAELTEIEQWVCQLLVTMQRIKQQQLPGKAALELLAQWRRQRPLVARHLHLSWLKPLFLSQQIAGLNVGFWSKIQLALMFARL